jgi:hypothetical protein
MGLLGAPTYPMLRDATQRALVAVLEENELPYSLNKSESYVELPHCRARILLRSLDDYERLRGTNLAWFGVDELTYCKEEAWLRLEGRLREPKAQRRCGYAVWTPKGMDWVHRRFVLNESGEYGVVLARANENRHILRTDPGFYERLKNTYSDAFYRQEVLGEYLANDGSRVYGAFRRDLHLRSMQRNPRATLLWTLDFNVDPFCTLVCQREKDHLHVIDEIVMQRKTSTEMAEKMNDDYGQMGHTLAIYGDASGRSEQTNGPNNYKQIVAALGSEKWQGVELRVPKRNPPVLERLHLVNRMLESAAKEVCLFIDPKCRSLIADLEQVQFRSDGVTVNKDGDSRRTHSADALGYLLWEEFGPRPQIGEFGVPDGDLVLG